MTELTSTFTHEEWATLKRGPVFMLHHVAGADSHIDGAEWTALIDAVAGGAQAEETLVRDVMTELGAELHANALGAPDAHPPLEGLRQISSILGRALPGEASSFKAALLEIGAALAEASGTQLVRTFDATATERAALNAAVAALDMSS
jgi:hypothetical protein